MTTIRKPVPLRLHLHWFRFQRETPLGSIYRCRCGEHRTGI